MSTSGIGSHLEVVLLMYGERGDTAFRRFPKLSAKILDCSKLQVRAIVWLQKYDSTATLTKLHKLWTPWSI